jgi:hypothetical protein
LKNSRNTASIIWYSSANRKKYIQWSLSNPTQPGTREMCQIVQDVGIPQALVSFKKYMSPPLLYFKVNIYPFPLPHFASIFFAYL